MPEGEPGQRRSVHPPCDNRDYLAVPAGSVSEVEREVPPLDTEADPRAVIGVIGRGIIVATRRAVTVMGYVVRPVVLVVVHVAAVVDIPVVVVVVGSRSIRVVTVMVAMARPVTVVGSSSRGERDTESHHDSETQK